MSKCEDCGEEHDTEHDEEPEPVSEGPPKLLVTVEEIADSVPEILDQKGKMALPLVKISLKGCEVLIHEGKLSVKTPRGKITACDSAGRLLAEPNFRIMTADLARVYAANPEWARVL